LPSAWETPVIQSIRAKSLSRLCGKHHALRLGLIFPANKELTGKFCLNSPIWSKSPANNHKISMRYE